MKSFNYIILASFISFISCSDKNETTVENESLESTDSIVIDSLNSESEEDLSFASNPTLKKWLTYYKNGNPEFSLQNFTIQGTEKLELSKGNSLPSSDPKFDKVYLPFLVYNPSKTLYLDLDSYNWVPDASGNALFEADQEVNLVDPKNKSVQRVAFSGPSHWVDDAFWVNDSAFILLDNGDENQPGFQLFDLKNKSITSYLSNEPLHPTEKFYFEQRLKEKGITISE